MKDLWVVSVKGGIKFVYGLENTEVSKEQQWKERTIEGSGFFRNRKFILQSRSFPISDNSLRSRTHTLWHRAALSFLGIMQQDGLGGRVCWQLEM
jgi:hypothetical protein